MAAACLTGCGILEPSLTGDRNRSRICAAVPPERQEVAADAYQQAIQRDECIHRWSYAFARSPDEAEAVVGAVIGACRAQINRSATLLGNGDAEAERWYLAEMERASRERALYRVVQARAGGCI
jgi:hypothetical protein